MASAVLAIAGGFKAFVDKSTETMSSKGKTAKGLVIFVVITVLNQLLKKEYFKCPVGKTHGKTAWSFMFIPGIVLSILFLIGSDRVSHGSILCAKGPCASNAQFFCRNLTLTLSYSILALLSWIVATLLFTETYVCAKLGPPPTTTDKMKIQMYNIMKGKRQSESKVLGLYILMIAVLVHVLVFFIHKCCLSDLAETPNRMKSMDSYDKLEANAAKAHFESLVEKHGEANGKRMVAELAKLYTLDIENEPENNGMLSRERIEELRKELVKKYPRLDNPLDRRLPYREDTSKPNRLRAGEEETLL